MGDEPRAPGDKKQQQQQQKQQQQVVEQIVAHAHGLKSMLGRLAPFGLQMLVSGVAYGTGMCFIQLLGAGLRISCATPVLGPCLGAVGVGAASVLSGHMSRHTKRQMEAGKGPLQALASPFWHEFDGEEALLDAFSGLTLFKVAGGSFRKLMPSDLRAPGAFATHSVPLSSAKYATDVEKGQLISIFNRDGCHHCGSRRGPVIGDHIPPTKMVEDIRKERKALSDANGKQVAAMLMRQVKALLGVEPSLKQAYYAQCQRCSTSQGSLMRHGRRSALVLHRWIVAPGVLPGVLVGLRQFCSIGQDPGRGGGGGGAPRRPGSKDGRAADGDHGAATTGKQKRGLWGRWVTQLEAPEAPGSSSSASGGGDALLLGAAGAPAL